MNKQLIFVDANSDLRNIDEELQTETKIPMTTFRYCNGTPVSFFKLCQVSLNYGRLAT